MNDSAVKCCERPVWGRVSYIKDLGSFLNSGVGVSMGQSEGSGEWCQGQEGEVEALFLTGPLCSPAQANSG